jgi:molybdenum cofactor biosynthesis protein B
MGHHAHKKSALESVRLGILSISSSRTAAEDISGQWIGKRARKEGHRVVLYTVIPDDAEAISKTLLQAIDSGAPDAILMTGGTGISPKDVTIEAVRPLFEKELTAFATIFSQLSFEDIDSAALLSRATAGIVCGTAVFCMPGSLKACKLACRALIFPELGHIVGHLHEA